MEVCDRRENCGCVVVEVVRYFSENDSPLTELYHFPSYEQSPFLLQHRQKNGPKEVLLLLSPAYTKEVMEFLVWYLSPSLSPSSSSSTDPGRFGEQPPPPPRRDQEVFDRIIKSRRTSGYLVQNLIVTAHEFMLPGLEDWACNFIKKALILSTSATELRRKLMLDDAFEDLDEQRVWERNKIAEGGNGECLLSTELSDTDLSGVSLAFQMPIQPAVVPQPDETATKCSHPGCEIVFNWIYYGKHHCRKCAKVFCNFHSSHFVRLPKNEKVEPESIGVVSTWYTFVRNFGDSSLSRICDTCYNVVEEEKKCRTAFQAFQIMGLELPLLNRALVVTSSWRQAAQKCLGILANIQYILPEDKMTEAEIKVLWNNRGYFVGHPRWLLQIVRIADLQNESVAEEVHGLLLHKKKRINCSAAMCNCRITLGEDGSHNVRQQKCKGGFTPPNLLRLLKEGVVHPRIREFASESLRVLVGSPEGLEELRLYLPILVEMLRFEVYPDPSPLFKTLLMGSVLDPLIRYDFFWALCLRASSDSKFAARYESLKQLLLINLAVELENGRETVLKLTEAFCIYQAFRGIPKLTPAEEIKERLRISLAPYQNTPTICIFDPTHTVSYYHIDEIKVLNSATKPVVIPVTVECRDCDSTCKYRKDAKSLLTGPKSKKRDMSNAPLPGVKTKRRVMFKYEDVRRDHLVLTIIQLMDLILRRELSDIDKEQAVERITYRVIPTSIHDGFVEFVEGAMTIFDANIDDHQNVRTLQNWLLDHDQNKHKTFQTIKSVFLKTMAFWSVATLLLGVGDRHACNIMIKPNGALFHIDYGYILGEDPKKILNPPLMRITGDMLNVMGGIGSEGETNFKEDCWKIYEKLREHSLLFFDMCDVIFMWDPPLDGGPPYKETDRESLMNKLYDRFNWKVDSLKAEGTLKKWIAESAANPMPDIIDMFRKVIGVSTKGGGKKEGGPTTEQNDPQHEHRSWYYYFGGLFTSSGAPKEPPQSLPLSHVDLSPLAKPHIFSEEAPP